MSGKYVPMVVVFIAALATATCGGKGSPTSPTPTNQPPQPATPGSAAVNVTITPNPVPYSGKPITDVPGCANLNNTWYYDQVLKEESGLEVRFTKRLDTFDGWPINDVSNLNIVIPANGSITLPTRWCSATSAEHNAHSTFTGTDAKGNTVVATGGVVRLLKP